MTLEYAKEREQFGVPIGSFQAIKHKFADMLLAIERARATGYFAALTIAEDDERRTMATSMAKAAAGDAQRLVGKEGIQIHGGIGYTWEHDIHLYVRRAKADAALFGTAADHRARVADLLDWLTSPTAGPRRGRTRTSSTENSAYDEAGDDRVAVGVVDDPDAAGLGATEQAERVELEDRPAP